MTFKSVAGALALALFAWTAPASAVPIAQVGTTDVTVDGTVLDILAANSIAPSNIGGAGVSGATFSFDITGGDLHLLLIEHSGGVRFERGTDFLEASNFLIDGNQLGVFAEVNGSATGSLSGVRVFDLDNVDLSGPITADLLISDALNGAFLATFAPLFFQDEPLDSLAGARFGSAVTSPTPVPLPASALLLLAGLGGLAVVRRRRSAA